MPPSRKAEPGKRARRRNGASVVESSKQRPRGRETPAKKRAPRGRPRQSPADSETRRRQILAAALTVFSEHGFEAARLEDIAKRANVAKGTLYLYFKDKQHMFEELVRSAARPLLGNLSALSQQPDLPAGILLDRLFTLFRQEILGTERKLIMRLVISEGVRFPKIAAFYHREVISRVMGVLQNVAQRAWRRGQLATDGPARFPQLIAAPLLMSVIWDGLFDRIEPLEIEAMLEAHAELLTMERPAR